MRNASAGQPDQPAADEFEISVFGPGYGEAIAAHLGGGRWMLVDSCVDSTNGEPAALSYLRRIGVETDAVDLIVATHWHDDHIRGLAKTVESCPHARFACSAAFRSDQFLRLVATAEQETMTRETSGVAELGAVLAALSDRRGGATFVAPALASADRTLYRSPGDAAVQAVVTALSPSDAAIMQALRGFASLLPAAPNPKRRITSLEPNDASVALWVEVGARKVLLGADLEVTAAADRGWDAVVNSTTRPRGLASAFKIPHHGSVNGHSDRLWAEVIEPSPTTVTTRLVRGRNELPTDDDRRRIADRSATAILLGARRKAKAANDHAVDRTIREVTRSYRPAEGRTGHASLRTAASGPAAPWQVDCTGAFEELVQRAA